MCGDEHDQEPCCDGESLKIPCCPPVPPFRLHYFLVLIAIACAVFFAIDVVSPEIADGHFKNQKTNNGHGNQISPPSPLIHKQCVYLVIVVMSMMILGTLLHEGGHATATCCAPGGQVRHIMLNPCCGGHAFVGHQGNELWEAWISFAGPMWDIGLAFVYYFIQTGQETDGRANSIMLHKPLSTLGFNVKESNFMASFMKLSKLRVDGKEMTYAHMAKKQWGSMPRNMEMTYHALEDSDFFWKLAISLLMDMAFFGFFFNMLPIITLDGADFFGSWVRLCSTPMISAIFIICTSFICIGLLAIFELVIPGMEVNEKWDEYSINTETGKKQSPFRHPQVITHLAMGLLVLIKVLSLIKPAIKLTCHACKDKLYKYHFTQDHEGRKRENSRKRGYGNPPNVVIQSVPQYGRAIDY